jgi:hypothetical protein
LLLLFESIVTKTKMVSWVAAAVVNDSPRLLFCRGLGIIPVEVNSIAAVKSLGSYVHSMERTREISHFAANSINYHKDKVRD